MSKASALPFLRFVYVSSRLIPPCRYDREEDEGPLARKMKKGTRPSRPSGSAIVEPPSTRVAPASRGALLIGEALHKASDFMSESSTASPQSWFLPAWR
ncbi:hypothetical protein ACUV84_011427 [Puccinellia chinampoensis]